LRSRCRSPSREGGDRFWRQSSFAHEILADPRAGRRFELLPKVGCRYFVHLQQRLALRRALATVVGGFELGNRDAESRRKQLDGVGKADVLLQLDKLEDITAAAATEAVEESTVAMNGERRRLFTVKRAQSLVVCPRLLQ
jgi:hypothetical protein